MLYQGDRQTLEGAGVQTGQDEFDIKSIREDVPDKKQNLYLRYWGKDFPYLSDYGNCTQGCLPVPENSDVQRFIRDR
jgi:hypothetical protein